MDVDRTVHNNQRKTENVYILHWLRMDNVHDIQYYLIDDKEMLFQYSESVYTLLHKKSPSKYMVYFNFCD